MKIRYFLIILYIIGNLVIFNVNADNDTKTNTNFYITYNNITSVDNNTGKLEFYYNYIDEDDYYICLRLFIKCICPICKRSSSLMKMYKKI